MWALRFGMIHDSSVKFIVRKDGMDMKIRIKFNGHLPAAFFTQLPALQPSVMATKLQKHKLEKL